MTLSPGMLRQLRTAVAAGDYPSTSETLRDTVRTWQPQRSEETERLIALRSRAQRSFADPRPSLTDDGVAKRREALPDDDPWAPLLARKNPTSVAAGDIRTVLTLALPPRRWKGSEVSDTFGVEQALIKRFHPHWN